MNVFVIPSAARNLRIDLFGQIDPKILRFAQDDKMRSVSE